MNYKVNALALTISQHYRLLSEVLAKIERDHALPCRGDFEVADMLEDQFIAIGGKGLSNYFRLKFQKCLMTCNLALYNLPGTLVDIREAWPKGEFKQDLKERFEEVLNLIRRLARPMFGNEPFKIKTRVTRTRRTSKKDDSQLWLFKEDEVKTNKKANNDQRSTVSRKRGASSVRKETAKDNPRAAKKSKIDVLADEIIQAEYFGEDSDPYSDAYRDATSISNTDIQDFPGINERVVDDYSGATEEDF